MNYTPRQLDIIRSASNLIGAYGVHGLTIKNLAEAMKFSEPALYRHFKSKDEILRSVILYYKGVMQVQLAPIVSGSAKGIDKLGQLIRFQFGHFKKNPAIVMVIFSETSFQNNKVLSKTVLEIMKQKKILIESIIEFGQKDGSIVSSVDPDQLAIVVMGSMRLNLLHWRLTDFAQDLDEIRADLWKTLKVLLTK